MKSNKTAKRIKTKGAVKTAVSLLVILGLILASPLFSVPVHAKETQDDDPFSTPGLTITWEKDDAVRTNAAALSGETVFTVAYTVGGSPFEYGFTQDSIDSMLQGPFTYSNYNTFPSYGTHNDIYGVPVMELLSAAGINTAALGENQTIKFISGDGSGYNSTITVGQINEVRRFYGSDGTPGAEVPAIIGFSGDGDLPRNFFGQVAASEQTRNLFVRSTARIEVGGDAGVWGIPTANPVSGTAVSAGDLVRLVVPSGYPPEAKIHYTLNTTAEPTRDSEMYNRIADSWLGNHGLTENPPITVPEGSGNFTVNAKIFGIGRADGSAVTFTYEYDNGPAKQNQAPPTNLSGSALAILGTTTAMEYSADSTGASGWIRCTAGSTSVTPGTYFVRYAATDTHNASDVVMIVVSSKQNQSPPTGLSNGVNRIDGTTTAMEYHTDPYAGSGWIRCGANSTNVADGTYFVRFAETSTHNASSSVEIVVGKLNRAAPLNLSAGAGMIVGTTAEMEYHTNSTAEGGWTACTGPSTAVSPNTYYVRFRETSTHRASAVVMIVVTEHARGPTVISVYLGGSLAKEFSKGDVDALRQHGPNTYSSYNTWPTYETLEGMAGVRVMDLLSASGVSSLSSGQGIKFTSSDGYVASVTVGQLEEPRYFFNSSGARGAQLPSIINFSEGREYRRLVFGQAAALEQIHPSFVKDVVRIDVEGGAGNWGSPGVNPAAGTTVAKGDAIRLTMPSGQGDSKIYYTLDGSAPNRNSKMYNPVADRWLSQKGMTENAPIIAPSGSFTIRARIIGIGRGDGPEASFTFTAPINTNPGDNTGGVVETTIEDLIDGNLDVTPGNSIFVPAAYGTITWDESLFDGYYDFELGGYVLTPRPGVTGAVEFKYIDEDGVEHTLVVNVEAGNEHTINESQTPLAAMAPAGINAVGGDGTAGGMPQWAFIALVVFGAVAGGVFGVAMPDFIRRLRKRGSEVQ